MQGLICQIMLIWNYFVIFSFNYATTEKLYRETKFTIEVKGRYTDTLIESLRTHDFSLLHKITPSVYIFEYNGETHASHVIKIFHDQINEIEPVRFYNNELKPVQAESNVTGNEDYYKNYGMGIPKVWAKNITGKGVIIAINDVGINTDLLDLERNINKELGKNFFTNTSDVTPESFPELLDKPIKPTDHGNRVASVIAAVKGNNICSEGIAYDATIVPLKILQVIIENNGLMDIIPKEITTSEEIARSLIYKLDIIDIFVNAVLVLELFDQLDLAFREALKYGATKGRKGLGTIYVVPAGPYGNDLSHNNNTISVNSIGRFGTQPKSSYWDTSVLISGLHDGNNLTASSLATTSYGNKCVTDFKGASVAVSQVSAIIALALQTNSSLTLRDVQHLLVRSADQVSLNKTVDFQRNNASRYFHGKFGFGLINADKFVQLASDYVPVAPILTFTINNYTTRTIKTSTIFEFCHSCVMHEENCLTFIEHVMISINFTTEDSSLKMEIVSPKRTSSVIMDLKDQKTTMPSTKKGNIVTVHFWDEVAFGKWTIKVHNKYSTNQTKVHQISLILLGTRNADGKLVRSDKCDTEREMTIPDIDSMAPIYYVLAVVVSVVCICIIVSVICCWYRKRNNRPERGGNQSGDENVPMSVSSG